MNDEQKAELQRIQDMAVNNAIEEMSEAGSLTLATKDERGDRFWLTKMASQSLALAARVEAYVMLKQREGSGADHDTEETENKRVERMIASARSEVASIVAKAKKGHLTHK